jgi:pimeloyl-ACP methyl ester carboxylesterase
MTVAGPQFLRVGAGATERPIAYLADPGRAGFAPGVMWLSGLKSEMTSTKASVLADWAAAHGHPCTRFDYSGHGQSPGKFEDGTVGAWLEEALAVFRQVARGDQILVGSSMGGYIALLVLRALMREAPAEAARVRALLLIAPAWDMTERLMWARFSENVRRDIIEKGVYQRPSKYGDGDYAISRRLIEDGRQHLIGEAPFDPGRPIHVLHGLLDPDVPWEHTLDLVAHLSGDHVQVSAVPDGEHRLSRPEDLDLMIRALEGLVGMLPAT